MCADQIIEGWEVFERWSKRFKRLAISNERYAYCLSIASEVISSFESLELELDIEQFEFPQDSQERIKNRIDFLRDYLVCISFDAGNFHQIVKNILAYQAPRFCPVGYTVWLKPNDHQSLPPPRGLHFRGYDATLFCEHFSNYDYATVMQIAPFENIFVRNKGGKDWKEDDANAFARHLQEDLTFDGIHIELSHYYDGGKFHIGPLFAAWVTQTSL